MNQRERREQQQHQGRFRNVVSFLAHACMAPALLVVQLADVAATRFRAHVTLPAIACLVRASDRLVAWTVRTP
jgi:hypothetical protein